MPCMLPKTTKVFQNIDKARKLGFQLSVYGDRGLGLRYRSDTAFSRGQNLYNDELLPEVPPLEGNIARRYDNQARHFWGELSIKFVADQDKISEKFDKTRTLGFSVLNGQVGIKLFRCYAYSRYVLAWKISNSLDVRFCLDALDDAFQIGTPEIFNTDQGSQFTSEDHINKLSLKAIKISMDGRGRALDNVFIERLWRSLKYEYVYLHVPETGQDLYNGVANYFNFYNYERPHQSLGYQPPAIVHYK